MKLRDHLPPLTPGKANKEKQEEFVEKINQIINKNALIYFADAAHPTH